MHTIPVLALPQTMYLYKCMCINACVCIVCTYVNTCMRTQVSWVWHVHVLCALHVCVHVCHGYDVHVPTCWYGVHICGGVHMCTVGMVCICVVCLYMHMYVCLRYGVCICVS